MKKWRTIKNFKNVVDDMYQVSYEGEVRYKKSKDLIHKKIANKKHHPYYAVNLLKTNGKKEWVLVHQLVATFFVKVSKKYIGTEKGLVPDHLDNNGLNNLYTNLEWKTRGETVKSAHLNGWINNSGSNNKNSTLSELEVRTICVLLEEGKQYDYIIDIMCLPKTKQMRQTLIRIKNRLA